jgi:hypothetical protein
VTEQLKFSYILFDVETGERVIPHEYGWMEWISEISRLSRLVASGKQDLFQLRENNGRYTVVAGKEMKKILQIRSELAHMKYTATRGINPECELFINKFEFIQECGFSGKFEFWEDAHRAKEVHQYLNGSVNEFRKVANSAHWKKMVRNFYRKVNKNHASMRDYLSALSRRHSTVDPSVKTEIGLI